MESVLCFAERLSHIVADRAGKRRSHFRHRVIHTDHRRVAFVVPWTLLLNAGTVKAVFGGGESHCGSPSTVARPVVTLIAVLQDGHV